MMKLLYFVLAGPFLVPAKIVSFVYWEILDTGWKKKIRFPNPNSYNDYGAYIQHLLKENVEEKKRADELHKYYERQLKLRDSKINRLSS